MRSTRTAKYRKNYKKIIVLGQILLIWYALVFSISLLTTETEAYFSNYSTAHTSISTASYWWDKSDLEIVDSIIIDFEEDEEAEGLCLPVVIETTLKNKGVGMTGSTDYEVFFSDDGDVVNSGEIIYTGIIEPIEENATSLVSFEAHEEGYYVLKVYQREGYNHNYEERYSVWSNVSEVECPEVEESDEETKEESDDEDTKEDTAKEQDGNKDESSDNTEDDKSKEDKKDVDKDKDKELEKELDKEKKEEEKENEKSPEVEEKEEKDIDNEDVDKEKEEEKTQEQKEEKDQKDNESDSSKKETDTEKSNEDEDSKQDGE
ncbi:amyloid fiber anchoring/assembly protein TapA [Evansella sp. AB-rgal1]|uniref:amyloid fiber anchoring/assembly protein TapA n=1 Tax=Evansella sp. AB-rgal1 TaxID=3242696 RepID=UPI00359F0622